MLTIPEYYALSVIGFGLAILVVPYLMRCYYWCCFQLRFPPIFYLLQGLLFVIYLAMNGVCLGLLAENDLLEISRRSAILSIVNMIPLFMVDRSMFLALYLGIPLHVHHLLHRWMGRVSVLEAFLHVTLVFVARVNQNQLTSSGITISSALGCLLIFSFIPFRIYMFETFLHVHRILAILSLATLLWHIKEVDGSDTIRRMILPSILTFLWIFNRARSIYNLRRRSDNIEITPYHTRNRREPDVLKIQINLKDDMFVRPGQFLYLRFQNFYFWDQIQTHPFMISWWGDKEIDQEEASVTKHAVKEKARFLTILIQPANGLTKRLNKSSISLQGVSFDGPLGRDLKLEKFENVFLAVKGIGIAGVLSYAKHLVELKSDTNHSRQCLTRKLDLCWELEDNAQDDWGGPFLESLKAHDKISKILQVICYFPSKKESESRVKVSKNCRVLYPDTVRLKLNDVLEQITTKSPGRSIVVACGIAPFTNSVRSATLKAMSSINSTIHFAEAEYRPYKIRENTLPDSLPK